MEGIRLVNPDGSGSRLLVASSIGPGTCVNVHGCGMGSLSWSPDRTKLAFWREDPSTSPSTSSVFAINANGSDQHHLVTCERKAPQTAAFLLDESCDGVSWSPDGNRLVVATGGVLYLVDADGKGLRALTHRDLYSEGVDSSPAWSPDGSRIMFLRGSVYTVRPNGSALKRVRGTGGAASAHWFPDGRTIAFTVATDLGFGDKVFSVGIDGSRLRLRLTTPELADLESATWSPDGTRIAYETEHRIGGNQGGFAADVWLERLDSTSRTRLFHEDCCIDYSPRPLWSPNGRQIAITAGGQASS